MESISLKLEGPRKTIFEAGALSQLGAEARALGGEKVLLVADPQVVRLDFFGRAKASLEEAGCRVVVFSELRAEPAPEEADEAAALARQSGCQVVVGLGGGSAMDVAKAAAALAGNDGRAVDYIGVELLPKAGLPKIMVPTTAGTGSEATWTSVFTMRQEKRKGGINSPHLYPETVILDPDLTMNLPAEVTAYTGLDALTHAVEAFVAKRSNIVSNMYALTAIELIGQCLVRAVKNGADDTEAREGMLLGAHLAGRALAGAGVGACHGLAYPLGAFYGVGHGTANAVLLAHIMEFNAEAEPDKFTAIAWALGLEPGESAIEFVAELCREIGIPLGLGELGIPREALREMAEAALNVKLCMDNNPRPMSLEEVLAVYKTAY